MNAVVLTCDRYHAVARHMIDRYTNVWSDHPFRFLVSHQEIPFPEGPRVTTRRTPAAIRNNALRLLDGFEDEAWIYWCMDDKFPVVADVARVCKIHRWVEAEAPSNVCGVLFCKGPAMLGSGRAESKPSFEHSGLRFHKCLDYSHIWIHQYARVKVLRHLFLSFPDVIPDGKSMDKLKNAVQMPEQHELYVTSRDLAVFGESVSRGALSLRCKHSMIDMGIDIPEWFQGRYSAKGLIGDMGLLWRSRIAAADLGRRIRRSRRSA